jgi:hypothetical protein
VHSSVVLSEFVPEGCKKEACDAELYNASHGGRMAAVTTIRTVIRNVFDG